MPPIPPSPPPSPAAAPSPAPSPSPSVPARSLFYAFGAWVGRLDGRTACAWWPDDPNRLGFDPRQLVEVDLARTPAAYLRGEIARDEIQIDDAPPDGGLTRLGPTWPTGSTINSLWLESRYHAGLPRPPAFPQPFMGCRDYELTAAIYWSPDGKAIERRCWGHHCEIAAEQGSLALCTIWAPGAVPQRPAGSWWIDLAAHADPIANGLTAIDTGAAPKRGALFLDADVLRHLALAAPKLPSFQGGQLTPVLKR